MSTDKPLGHKAYGSIPHLPNSRTGAGDHYINPQQGELVTHQLKNKNDKVFVLEKLDGSCCSVAKINGVIVPLGRAGYRAETSKYKMHHLFAEWVAKRYGRFDSLLEEGERVVGEWLIQAHGTRYQIDDPEYLFGPFDIMRGTTERLPYEETRDRLWKAGFVGTPFLIASLPMPPDPAIRRLKYISTILYPRQYIDPVEGVVYRYESKGKVLFLTKYVVPDKEDGKYLDEEVWNWEGSL